MTGLNGILNCENGNQLQINLRKTESLRLSHKVFLKPPIKTKIYNLNLSGFVTILPQFLQKEGELLWSFVQIQNFFLENQQQSFSKELNKLRVKMAYRTIRETLKEDNIVFDKQLINYLMFRPPFVCNETFEVADKDNMLYDFYSILVKNFLQFENKNDQFKKVFLKFFTEINHSLLAKIASNHEFSSDLKRFEMIIESFEVFLHSQNYEFSLLLKVIICAFFIKINGVFDKLKNTFLGFFFHYWFHQLFPNLQNFISFYVALNSVNQLANNAYGNTVNSNYDLTYFIAFIYHLLELVLKGLQKHIVSTFTQKAVTSDASFNRNLINLKKLWPQLSNKQIMFLTELQGKSTAFLIADFQKITKCSYETARYSLAELVDLNILNCQKHKRRFVYTLNFNL